MADPFSYGWATGTSSSGPMRNLHLHMDLEFNLVIGKPVEVIVTGRRLCVGTGQAVAFWAGTPHALVTGGDHQGMRWITAPMRWILGLPIPTLREALMAGSVLTLSEDECRTLARWPDDLDRADGAEIVRLECEALLRRREQRRTTISRPSERDALDRMLTALADGACGPLSVAMVARAAGLSESRAMHAFKAATGTTIRQHLAGLRVAHAQRLLLEGRCNGTTIATACGFASLSAFHAEFRRHTGTSPIRWAVGTRT